MTTPIAQFSVDRLEVLVFEDRVALGHAAALEVARIIARRQKSARIANIIFAAAPSQNEFLESLVQDSTIDWSKVIGLHMDEYLGLDPDHPASFRRYLHEHLFDRVGLTGESLKLISGEDVSRPLRTCMNYEDILKTHPQNFSAYPSAYFLFLNRFLFQQTQLNQKNFQQRSDIQQYPA